MIFGCGNIMGGYNMMGVSNNFDGYNMMSDGYNMILGNMIDDNLIGGNIMGDIKCQLYF